MTMNLQLNNKLTCIDYEYNHDNNTKHRKQHTHYNNPNNTVSRLRAVAIFDSFWQNNNVSVKNVYILDKWNIVFMISTSNILLFDFL